MSRNNSIDSLKLICAMLVVFIHCEYSYKHSVLPITDVAVPLFFAISGYFVFGAKRKWERISRIANIFAWSAALYLLKTESFNLLTTHQLWLPTWKDITNFLFFNDVAFSLHLWYLPAYIYVLDIAFFIDRYGAWRMAMWTILPLLLAKVFIKYETLDWCSSTLYYRNAFFNGLPYFLLGAFCKQIFPPCLQKFLVGSKLLAIALFFWVVALFVIRYNLQGDSYEQLVLNEMNLMMLVFSIMFFVTHVVQRRDNIFSFLGRQYSLYIYIFHLLIMQICEMAVIKMPTSISSLYMNVNPFVVFMLSIVFTYLLGKLRILKI